MDALRQPSDSTVAGGQAGDQPVTRQILLKDHVAAQVHNVRRRRAGIARHVDRPAVLEIVASLPRDRLAVAPGIASG